MTKTDSMLFTRNIFNPKAIEDFCKSWKLKEFSVFGSVLSNDFTIESDIDIMIDFNEDTGISLLSMAKMKSELEKISKRKVDLLTRRGIESSPNYIRRQAILDSVEVIYEAG